MRVAVIGASGFVGSVVVRRLRERNDVEVVPCIHGSGNAGQIARLGIPLESVDLLDASATSRALHGCTHVVNCSRGGEDVMLKGLRNLLQACEEAKVRRFVHLSSVAVYGDPPARNSDTEDGSTNPERNTYGWLKLLQDKMVMAAAKQGLSAIILCPPNISGVQSVYLDAVVQCLLKGELALIEGGQTPCNLVDVENLVHAIGLALQVDSAECQRVFVTDDYCASWSEIVEALRPIVGAVNPPEIARSELERMFSPEPAKKVSLLRSALHLVSSDVRQALRKDPLWERVDSILRNGVRILGAGIEDRMRLAVEGSIVVPDTEETRINVRLCAQQLRGVVHRCDRAKKLLGYRPLYSFQQSMEAYCSWYRYSRGWDLPVGDLLQAA